VPIVEAGDICAIAGAEGAQIGDTLSSTAVRSHGAIVRRSSRSTPPT
jgi:predicted membrane GTPase involved in stress response